MEKVKPSISSQNEKEKSETSKKYNFYRKPSIKKKVPEVKQTLTSYRRMLKANPLLKYELEGKDISVLNKPISDSQSKGVLDKSSSEKQSLQPNFNAGKPLISNLQRSKSLKNPSKYKSTSSLLKTSSKVSNTIISGNKPKTTNTNLKSTDISRQSNINFNTSTSRFLCSTKLENTSRIQNKKPIPVKTNASTKTATKTNQLTQHNSISSSVSDKESRHDKQKIVKPIRRSLSAQHFDRKKGIIKNQPKESFSHSDLTKSLDDVTNFKPVILSQDISPIPERSQENSIIFKTPSAYERRSVARFTPISIGKRSIYHPRTPLPSLGDLQKRLNDWLVKRGKCPSSFNNLKCFGAQDQKNEPIDEENKENIEVEQDLAKGSYEDLRILVKNDNNVDRDRNQKTIVLNEDNTEAIARAALDDLQKLILEGYPRPQCEGWLELIRQKYRKLEEEPQYWECRAAIEQSRGNIGNAVQCYKTAIVQGAEIQSVDESLDILLQKFSLLNISTGTVESETDIRERARIVKDARNVFKSSIIQFAVQERKLKKNNRTEERKKLVATPVRRSTRLSRTAYTSTPGVKICSSLLELNSPDRIMVDFQKNKAFF